MADMAGFQFDRARIGTILKEIERQKKAKKDFSGDTRQLSARAVDGTVSLEVNLEGKDKEVFSFTKTAREQIAQSIKVPMTLWDRMENDPKHRDKLAELVTHFLHEEPMERLVRTLDGKCRSWLSPRYRMLDNADLFFVSAEEFQKVDAEIWEARLHEDGYRIYAVQPGISARVNEDAEGNKFEAGDDEHIAAVSISNSETGRGKLKVRPATLRKVCWNLNVWDETLSQIHLGRKMEEEGWISENTQRLEDKLTWSKVRDIVKTAFDPKKFQEVIAKLRGAKTDQIPDPVKAVEAVVELTDLPERTIDSIRAKFLESKDFTRYGLVQAVTAQVHNNGLSDSEKDAFDDAGAKILAMPMKEVLA